MSNAALDIVPEKSPVKAHALGKRLHARIGPLTEHTALRRTAHCLINLVARELGGRFSKHRPNYTMVNSLGRIVNECVKCMHNY